jgi:histidyl-tRNA synthetase
LRKNNIPVFFDYKYNLKKSLSYASNVNARYAIIIGEEEVKKHSYTIKDLKKNTQKTILFDSLISFLKA